MTYIFREFYDRAVDWAQVSLERASTAEERTYMRKILGTILRTLIWTICA